LGCISFNPTYRSVADPGIYPTGKSFNTGNFNQADFVALTQAEFSLLLQMVRDKGLQGQALSACKGMVRKNNPGITPDSRQKLIKIAENEDSVMSEALGFYEIFIIQKLSFDEVSCAISKSMKVSLEKIGSQVDFFNILSEDKCLILGVEMNYLIEGYLTFIRLVSTIEFQEYEYYNAIAKMALDLGINVATYSFCEMENIIVFYPDWNYQKAFESQENDDKFIVEVYGDKKNVEDLLKTLQHQ
jgi:hypothetical protein